jgi:hypothetical protein
MQQFTVPQFIDVESKIIGPITTRQFVIFLVAAVLIGACYRLFDFSLFVTIAVIIFIVAAMFAFIKVNGRPFHLFILNAIQTIRRPRLRIWNNNAVMEVQEKQIDISPAVAKPAPKEYYKKSRLAEVALIVDTQGRYKGE